MGRGTTRCTSLQPLLNQVKMAALWGQELFVHSAKGLEEKGYLQRAERPPTACCAPAAPRTSGPARPAAAGTSPGGGFRRPPHVQSRHRTPAASSGALGFLLIRWPAWPKWYASFLIMRIPQMLTILMAYSHVRHEVSPSIMAQLAMWGPAGQSEEGCCSRARYSSPGLVEWEPRGQTSATLCVSDVLLLMSMIGDTRTSTRSWAYLRQAGS